MLQAAGSMAGETNQQDRGEFYWQLAQMVLGDSGLNESWKLQALSDVSTLPDYDEGYHGGYYPLLQGGRGSWPQYWQNASGAGRGAPVQGDGTPSIIVCRQAGTSAQNDGERWRWTLHRRCRSIRPVLASAIYPRRLPDTHNSAWNMAATAAITRCR